MSSSSATINLENAFKQIEERVREELRKNMALESKIVDANDENCHLMKVIGQQENDLMGLKEQNKKVRMQVQEENERRASFQARFKTFMSSFKLCQDWLKKLVANKQTKRQKLVLVKENIFNIFNDIKNFDKMIVLKEKGWVKALNECERLKNLAENELEEYVKEAQDNYSSIMNLNKRVTEAHKDEKDLTELINKVKENEQERNKKFDLLCQAFRKEKENFIKEVEDRLRDGDNNIQEKNKEIELELAQNLSFEEEAQVQIGLINEEDSIANNLNNDEKEALEEETKINDNISEQLLNNDKMNVDISNLKVTIEKEESAFDAYFSELLKVQELLNIQNKIKEEQTAVYKRKEEIVLKEMEKAESVLRKRSQIQEFKFDIMRSENDSRSCQFELQNLRREAQFENMEMDMLRNNLTQMNQDLEAKNKELELLYKKLEEAIESVKEKTKKQKTNNSVISRPMSQNNLNRAITKLKEVKEVLAPRPPMRISIEIPNLDESSDESPSTQPKNNTPVIEQQKPKENLQLPLIPLPIKNLDLSYDADFEILEGPSPPIKEIDLKSKKRKFKEVTKNKAEVKASKVYKKDEILDEIKNDKSKNKKIATKKDEIFDELKNDKSKNKKTATKKDLFDYSSSDSGQTIMNSPIKKLIKTPTSSKQNANKLNVEVKSKAVEKINDRKTVSIAPKVTISLSSEDDDENWKKPSTTPIKTPVKHKEYSRTPAPGPKFFKSKSILKQQAPSLSFNKTTKFGRY